MSLRDSILVTALAILALLDLVLAIMPHVPAPTPAGHASEVRR